MSTVRARRIFLNPGNWDPGGEPACSPLSLGLLTFHFLFFFDLVEIVRQPRPWLSCRYLSNSCPCPLSHLALGLSAQPTTAAAFLNPSASNSSSRTEALPVRSARTTKEARVRSEPTAFTRVCTRGCIARVRAHAGVWRGRALRPGAGLRREMFPNPRPNASDANCHLHKTPTKNNQGQQCLFSELSA